jgi:NTP pyrophosphatase (non-canonical NTP hydrolase)
MTVQDIMKSIEDQEELFEVIRKRRIEQQEAAILAHCEELRQAISNGTAKRGSVQDLIADLLGDDDASRQSIIPQKVLDIQ